MRILAIDPGLGGALACYNDELFALAVVDMPTLKTKTRQHIAEAELVRIIRAYAPHVAVIEQVHALPKQGVTSTFNFGLGYGLARGILAALEIPVTFLTPPVWRRIAQVQGLAGDKAASRLRAMQLFPKEAHLFSKARDHGRAEAALIGYAFLTGAAKNQVLCIR